MPRHTVPPRDYHTLSTFCFDPDSQTFIQKRTNRDLGVNEVLIQTLCSGICFTDVHAKSKGCGLGHEGVGEIIKVGAGVRTLQSGDRVGWGWLHSSCGGCTTCHSGYRQYCSQALGFAFSDLDQGAFGDFRIIDADFAYLIPDAISEEHAAPLMCAGASVFEALDAAGTSASDRIGVVGVGGLGHMAILFAKAMGCGVTALSRTASKMNDAFELGADEFRCLSNLPVRHHNPSVPLYENADKVDILLVTSNAVPEMEVLLPLLNRRATIVLMTIQSEPVVIPYMAFVLPGHRVIASTEASRENHEKMLEFAARHQIKPRIQTFPMTSHGIAEAFSLLEHGLMRFRGVLIQP